mmetsp:Transcript_3247/g.9924  ORF Transcript_3247/g.9924 Transcript_3247/m.9924 type:complete len:363 (-) Transcript_3247:182-1270(-)
MFERQQRSGMAWVCGPLSHVLRRSRRLRLTKRRKYTACAEKELHKPVLLQEVLEQFRGRKYEVFVDGTLGAGGHATALLESCDIERYIGLDQDASALEISRRRLSKFEGRVEFVRSNFADMVNVLRRQNVDMVDGCLLDIGVSSMQLDTPQRGFSFMSEGPLDMRMNRDHGITAAEVVNTFDEGELGSIFRELGDEPRWRRMARSIAQFRENRPINTTFELTEALMGKNWASGNRPRGYPLKTHPATRVFQALRIYVNNELDSLEEVLPNTMELLRPGSGRLAVITFHSLEDRIVKHMFREGATLKGGVRDLTRRPICPSERELDENPRSRSAKLRVVERLASNEDPSLSKNKYRRRTGGDN